VDVAGEASNAAVQILIDYWDRTLPIDPERIARAMGIEVAEESLDSGVSGRIEKRDGRPARISLSKLVSKVRRRFTLAHELGHFVRNPDCDLEYEDFRVEDAHPAQRSEDERFADAFAAELLMPETVVRQLVGLGVGTKQMANEFKVSVAAMTNRLEKLGLLPPNHGIQ
jgi:Zn-dependent peptidase ImmA (M78 family)